MLTEEQIAANVAAASAPQILQLGGRTFVLPIPTLSDFFAQRDEIRKRLMNESKDPLELLNERISTAERKGRPFSPTVIKSMTEIAMAASGSKETKSEPTDAAIHAKATSVEMLKWWAVYLIRKADATVDEKWIDEQLPDDNAVFTLSVQLGKLLNMAKLDPN